MFEHMKNTLLFIVFVLLPSYWFYQIYLETNNYFNLVFSIVFMVIAIVIIYRTLLRWIKHKN